MWLVSFTEREGRGCGVGNIQGGSPPAESDIVGEELVRLCSSLMFRCTLLDMMTLHRSSGMPLCPCCVFQERARVGGGGAGGLRPGVT